MKIPFQIYDFVGVLFPGALVLFVVGHFHPELNTIIPNSSTASITFFLVGAFLIGNLIQNISRNYYLKVLKPAGNFSSSYLKRKVFSELAMEQKENIKKGLKSFYNLTSIRDDDLEHLCYSPVYDRMGVRNTFVSLADFQRSISFLSLMGGIASFIYYIIVAAQKRDLFIGVEYLLIFVVLLFVSLQFLKGYILFTKFAATIVYSSFYSWWMEKELNSVADGGKK